MFVGDTWIVDGELTAKTQLLSRKHRGKRGWIIATGSNGDEPCSRITAHYNLLSNEYWDSCSSIGQHTFINIITSVINIIDRNNPLLMAPAGPGEFSWRTPTKSLAKDFWISSQENGRRRTV